MRSASHRIGHRLHSRRALLRQAASCARWSVLLRQVRRHGDTCGRRARFATYSAVRPVAGIGLEDRPGRDVPDAQSLRLTVAVHVVQCNSVVEATGTLSARSPACQRSGRRRLTLSVGGLVVNTSSERCERCCGALWHDSVAQGVQGVPSVCERVSDPALWVSHEPLRKRRRQIPVDHWFWG